VPKAKLHRRTDQSKRNTKPQPKVTAMIRRSSAIGVDELMSRCSYILRDKPLELAVARNIYLSACWQLFCYSESVIARLEEFER
jgi:hypothetical protein